MENWEDQEFNNEWKQALVGAEATPGNHVWEKIDAHMLVNENVAMKKRVVFYQRLAAASVGVLFLTVGYAFWSQSDKESELALLNSDTKQSEVAANKPDSNSTIPATVIDETNSQTGSNPLNPINSTNKSTDAFHKSALAIVDNSASTDKKTLLDSENQQNLAWQSLISTNQEHINSSNRLFQQETTVAVIQKPELTSSLPKQAQMNALTIAYALADARPAVHKKKGAKNLAEQTWAALGFAAGGFMNNPSNLALMQSDFKNSFSGNAGIQASRNSGQTEKQKMGNTYSFSLAGGKRIAKRWILQGGVSYMNQYSESVTQLIETQAAYNAMDKLTSFGPENSNAVTYSTDSEINSTFQFISMPVQAGYMLVDQKFGVQLNGGVSPDVFLRSTVTDKASGTETVNSTGSNSTFKAVSLSGLGGVELSYRFTEHYRISLVPGFRYSLTPVYKENSLASAKPFTADIGLRFRYVFN